MIIYEKKSSRTQGHIHLRGGVSLELRVKKNIFEKIGISYSCSPFELIYIHTI